MLNPGSSHIRVVTDQHNFAVTDLFVDLLLCLISFPDLFSFFTSFVESVECCGEPQFCLFDFVLSISDVFFFLFEASLRQEASYLNSLILP